MYSNETVQSLLRRSRKRLDEVLDTQTNFWAESEFVEYMNEGMREVWQSTRETHQNWFVRQMTSLDGIKNIGGRKYDTASFRLTQGASRLLLPPDFYELLLFEGLNTPTNLNRALILEYSNMTNHLFRDGTQDRRTEFDPIIVSIQRYRYDVVYGPEGPYIFLAPTIHFELPFETQIAYISMPMELTAQGTFEGTGFTTLMVDAILAYTLYAAVKKEDLTENLVTFKDSWEKKRELAWRAASPKQSRDNEEVDGFLEEEFY